MNSSFRIAASDKEYADAHEPAGAQESTSASADIRAVLFDLDGTLIDTKDLILSSFRHAFSEVVGEIPPEDELANCIGIPLAVQMRRLCPEHEEELLLSFRKFNHRMHDELARDFAGVGNTMSALKTSGLRLAVVTSKMHALAWHGLELFGLDGYCEFLIGADDCTEHKPAPSPLLLAAKQMGLNSKDCAYVGDSPYDMQAAKSASMLAVGAAWGMYATEILLKAGADKIAQSPEELLSAGYLVAAS